MSISHDGGVLIKTVDEDIVGHKCFELACEEGESARVTGDVTWGKN